MSSWWWKGSRALRRSLRGFHGVPNVPWLDRRTSHGNSPTNHPRTAKRATGHGLERTRRLWCSSAGAARGASVVDVIVEPPLSWAAGSSGTRVILPSASAGHRVQRLRRRELLTTSTDDSAMVAPAIIGLSRPNAASGMAAVL